MFKSLISLKGNRAGRLNWELTLVSKILSIMPSMWKAYSKLSLQYIAAKSKQHICHNSIKSLHLTGSTQGQKWSVSRNFLSGKFWNNMYRRTASEKNKQQSQSGLGHLGSPRGSCSSCIHGAVGSQVSLTRELAHLCESDWNWATASAHWLIILRSTKKRTVCIHPVLTECKTKTELVFVSTSVTTQTPKGVQHSSITQNYTYYCCWMTCFFCINDFCNDQTQG